METPSKPAAAAASALACMGMDPRVPLHKITGSPSSWTNRIFHPFPTSGVYRRRRLGTGDDVIATRRISLVGLLWIVIGVIVAVNRHYFAHLNTASDIGSAILAILV